MDQNKLHELFYHRAKEVQPQIQLLVQTFEAEGLSQEDIILEISFALINEGYRLRDMADGVKVGIPQKRKLQTIIDQEKLCESAQYKEESENDIR